MAVQRVLEYGDYIILEPKTEKGLKKLEKHGRLWKVESFDEPECLKKQPGIFLSSADDGHMMWICECEDPNYDTDFHGKETTRGNSRSRAYS